jgi:hypothetical protein
MVMIELCYCKITGRTRALPKVHHFIPLAPWTCNKIKGKRKQMNIDSTNDGPSSKFEKKEQIKLVLDMSNDGPTFRMLESMLAGGKGGENGAYSALAKLMQSGIPGLESFLTPGGMGKMSDEDKKRFIEAVTGAGGKIDSRAAAALIAAAASGGDPEIANKIIEKMMSGLGDEIDPAMMSALMATTALVAAGASNEEVRVGSVRRSSAELTRIGRLRNVSIKAWPWSAGRHRHHSAASYATPTAFHPRRTLQNLVVPVCGGF